MIQKWWFSKRHFFKRQFSKNQILKKTDFKTFVSLDQRGFGKDKNHVYFRGKIMTDIDAKTFEVTSMMYENELKNTTAEHCFSP